MQASIIKKDEILKIYKSLNPETHKNNQGHALLIGGSYGKIGSIVLASRACLKSGCGLVTSFVPKCGYQTVQISFLEAMVLTDKRNKKITNIKFDFIPNSIAIGMGMGQKKATQKAFLQFLEKNTKPLLIDADGLNILAKNKKWIYN